MDVRKMMGRLYAQTVRYDTGRGGAPELTPQDIAAAVGMCKHELARETFCWIWWPQSTAATARARELLLRVVLTEFNERNAAVDEARRRQRSLEALAALNNRVPDELQQDVQRAKAVVRQLYTAVWPAKMERYPSIVDAVIAEMRDPRHCPDCEGRGTVDRGFLKHDCPRCAGTGHVGEFNAWRAEHLGVSETRFRATWLPIYQWVYAKVEELVYVAARDIHRSLAPEEISG